MAGEGAGDAAERLVYDDEFVSVVNALQPGSRQLVIKNYYFPLSTPKTVACADLESIEDYTQKFTVFADKSWGMGPSGIWWARHMMRWREAPIGFIVLKVRGDWIRKGFSCRDVGRVLALCVDANPDAEARQQR